jgi:hypothetical protein
MLPVVTEEALEPDSTSKKIVAHQVKRWTTKPIGKFEKRFDLNKNGHLDPEERVRLQMARGYYQGMGNVWKYDKNKDYRLDAGEYYQMIPQE